MSGPSLAELMQDALEKSRLAFESALDAARERYWFPFQHTPWSGGYVCRICDRPLSQIDRMAGCPRHDALVHRIMAETQVYLNGKS